MRRKQWCARRRPGQRYEPFGRRLYPRYVVPADDERNARLIVSGILHETRRALKMRYPSVDAPRQREL